MRSFLCVLVLIMSEIAAVAETPATVPADRVVGSIYGKEISAAEIGLSEPIDPTVTFDARDEARWQLMTRISQTFGSPIVQRFVAEKRIEATPDEIAVFREASKRQSLQRLRWAEERLNKTEEELRDANLPAEKRKALEARKAQLERLLPMLREPAGEKGLDSVARQVIGGWKVERELHRTYGGRIIFQQAGPEALDARRKLFESAEATGDLVIKDAGVRHYFYYYYSNLKHADLKADALEKPWFLGDPAE